MQAYVLRPAAVADLRRAHAWYEKERQGLGEEFLRQVHAVLTAIRKTPRAFPVVHRATRRAVVPRFPYYGLYYRVLGEVVVFVACYHTRRHPRGWKGRH